MIKYLSLIAVVYFFYWLIKQKIRKRKLEQQGIKVEEQGVRPITLMMYTMIVMYGGYMLYVIFFSDTPIYL